MGGCCNSASADVSRNVDIQKRHDLIPNRKPYGKMTPYVQKETEMMNEMMKNAKPEDMVYDSKDEANWSKKRK